MALTMDPTTAARPEIAFFDLETTVPTRNCGRYALLEFGAIVVCPRRLVEVGSYSILIRPADEDTISVLADRRNGITRDSIANAPPFRDVADAIYGLLNGRIWAGHNIVQFDCLRIREAFAELGRPAPEPKGVIDTLPLLTERFGKRAGDMKLASLATYFGLGQQKHSRLKLCRLVNYESVPPNAEETMRSLDDVRMNLEVVKHCATVLFLEASFHPMDSSPLTEVHHRDISTIPESYADHMEHMKIDSLHRDTVFACSSERLCTDASISGCTGFLDPDELLRQHITAPVVFSHQYGRKINILHRDCPLQICSMGSVRFGVRREFTDHAGRPKINIVVDISDSLSNVLDLCDRLAQRSFRSCGSGSEWRPLIRRYGYSNPSSVRLHIPIVANGDAAMYSTEIYHNDPSGNAQKLVFSISDSAEFDSLFTPGKVMDAYFCLDTYDFRQKAGIRIVAKKLVLHAGNILC